MEPKPALAIKPVTVGGKLVPADRRVWVFAQCGDFFEVEYEDRRGQVPAECLVPLPVKAPDIGELRRLDSCFGMPESAFETEFIDRDKYFMIVRCCAHGSRFLRDSRGGVGMYELLTLLEGSDTGAPDDIWGKYHYFSADWLFWQGRTL